MSQFEKFNRKNVRELTAILNQELKEIGKKYGVQISLGNTKFSEQEFETKVKVLNSKAFSENKSEYQINWEQGYWMKHAGLKEDMLGMEVTLSNGNTYKVIGCLKKSQKYPVIAESKSGQTFKLPANLLAAQKQAQTQK